MVPGAGADVLLTVKANQQTLYHQLGCQFQGKRTILFTATDHEKKHGRDTAWKLRAKEAPEHTKQNWPGSAWIVEVMADTMKDRDPRSIRRHLFLTSLHTTPNDRPGRSTRRGDEVKGIGFFQLVPWHQREKITQRLPEANTPQNVTQNSSIESRPSIASSEHLWHSAAAAIVD